jgi:hypothetical protein
VAADRGGETFKQVRGGEFTYEVRGAVLRPDRTIRNLPKAQFEAALERVPISGPSDLQDLQGPSYLFAILTDARIRRGDW